MPVIHLYGDARMTKGIAETAMDTVAFVRTVVGNVRDTTILNAVRNVGARPLRVNHFEMQGTGAAVFSCQNSPSEFSIPPGEAVSLDLRFAPVVPGVSSGRLMLHHDGIGPPVILHLEGIAEAITGSAIVGIDTVSAFVGELVRLPILLKQQHDLVESGTGSISMELRYNASLLSPIGTTSYGRLEMSDRIIPLDSIPVDNRNGDTLAVLEFVATLGNATGTPLALEGLSADDGNSKLSARPGYFVLRGLCEEGGARLVDASGILSLKQNHPNPFNSRTAISFEIIERGPTRLLVKDLLGRTVMTVVDRWLEPGSYTHSLDASSLSSGSYICILQTPTRQLMRRMEVLK